MKHKKLIVTGVIVLAVVLIISALSNSTYALFSSDDYGANPNVYSTGNLSIEAKSKSEVISLNNALPMSDKEGMESIPYVFTIKNTGNVNYKFNVKLLSTGDSSTSFTPSYIKLQIDDGDVTTLSNLTGSMIKKDVVLAAGENIDISIRIWLDEGTPNSEIGKSFNSKIVIDGQGVYTVDEENSEETLVEYLTNKYLDANPTQATTANNGIYYYYAPSVNMMNDGMNSSHTWEDGANAGNIRYYGATPSNYIDIGDRDSSGNVIPWRIIGIFKNMTLADGTTDTLIKVIRDEPLSSTMQWDDDSNDWHNAPLQTYLNTGEYYTGLSQSVKDKIAKVEWNLGGWNTSQGVYSNMIYEKERGSVKCSSCTYNTIWEGDIAIMYPSDYGYAADLTACSKDLYNYDRDTTNCTGTDWLFNSADQWLLTPYSSNAVSAWFVHSSGYVYYNFYFNGSYGVRPVLYLSSELGIESGDGITVESAYVVK